MENEKSESFDITYVYKRVTSTKMNVSKSSNSSSKKRKTEDSGGKDAVSSAKAKKDLKDEDDFSISTGMDMDHHERIDMLEKKVELLECNFYNCNYYINRLKTENSNLKKQVDEMEKTIKEVDRKNRKYWKELLPDEFEDKLQLLQDFTSEECVKLVTMVDDVEKRLYKEAKTCNEKLESIEAKEERRVLALDTLIALKK